MTDSINDFRRESQLTTRGDSDTIELSFSSEAPVKRSDWNGDYMEILGHGSGEVDLSRLAGGDHPLLLNHDPEKQIGIVERAWVANGKGRARVRFGKSALATEILNDVKSGIRKLVSVGYKRTREISSEVRDGMNYVKFAFLPYEVSIVPIPADASVGVGRAGQDRLQHRIEIMQSDNNTPQNNPEAQRIADIQLISSRMAEKIPGCREICQRGITQGLSVAQVQEALFAAMPQPVPVGRPLLDVPDKELSRYSISRAILKAADAREGKCRFDGLEFETSREIEIKSGIRAQGFFVPDQVLTTRADNIVGTPSLGGALVATNLAAGSFIEVLRNKSFVARLGARFLDNLIGNVSIPRQTGAATASWKTEIEAAVQSNSVFGNITLSPRCVTGYEIYSKLLLTQSTPSIDSLIVSDLAQVIALAIDKAALFGAGGAEPTGIVNTTGICTVTVGATAPTFAHVVNMESAVALGNADVGSLAYLTNSQVRGKLKQTPRTTVSGSLMTWETPAGVRDGTGLLNGYVAAASNQIANNLTYGTATTICSAAFFGNWSDLLLGTFGSLDLVSDPYTLATTREVRVLMHQYCDVALRHAPSFAYAPDIVAG
jgi:HK97 family phage major capsid protein